MPTSVKAKQHGWAVAQLIREKRASIAVADDPAQSENCKCVMPPWTKQEVLGAALILLGCDMQTVASGARKVKSTVEARMKITASLRYFLNMSWPDIAKCYGKVRHSSEHEQWHRWQTTRTEYERDCWYGDVLKVMNVMRCIK